MSRSHPSVAIRGPRPRPVVAFTSTRWHDGHGRAPQLLSRLGADHPVLFVEQAVPEDMALPVCDSTTRTTWREKHPAPGVTVLGRRSQAQQVQEFLHEQDLAGCIVWTDSPSTLPLWEALNPSAVVYDFAEPRPTMLEAESALLQKADLVLAGGPGLFRELSARHSNVLCLHGAVDTRTFAPSVCASRLDRIAQAEQIQGRIPGPRLGCHVPIDSRMDFELLTALADAQPQWQVVMAGPLRGVDASCLPRRPNLHWLAGQPDSIMPQLIADWDACLIPYVADESTRWLCPPEVLHYMAAEKPVVSTALPDIVALYGSVLRVAHDAASFIDACGWALSETPCKREERLQEMQEIAARTTWDHCAQRVRQALADLLPVAAEVQCADQPHDERPAPQRHHATAVGSFVTSEPAQVQRRDALPQQRAEGNSPRRFRPSHTLAKWR